LRAAERPGGPFQKAGLGDERCGLRGAAPRKARETNRLKKEGEQEGGRRGAFCTSAGAARDVRRIISRIPYERSALIPPSRPSPSGEGEQRQEDALHPRPAVSSAAAAIRSLLRRDGVCTRGLFVTHRPGHRSLPRASDAPEGSRQEPLRFSHREPCRDGASQPDRAVDGRTNAARQPIPASDGENIPDDKLIPLQYGQIIPADGMQMPDAEQISLSIAGEEQIGPGMKGKNPGRTRKNPLEQGRKTDGRRSVRVSDFRGLGRKENQLAERKNELVRRRNASPGRWSGEEQKPGERRYRLPPCFRGVIERMQKCTAGGRGRWKRWGAFAAPVRRRKHNGLQRTDPTRIPSTGGFGRR